MKEEPITIGGVSVEKGGQQVIEIPIGQLSSGTDLTMPVRVIRGRQNGPVVFISAALHGDEINGVEVIRRLLRLKLLRRLSGTLIAVPVVNVFGFNSHSRYLPDRRDLNRSFPGSERGSLAARLANIFIEEIVAQSDIGIDLHTAAIHRSNLPQIRINDDEEKLDDLARVFGAPVVIKNNGPEGSLRGAAADLDVPVMLYEAGEALRFNEWAIQAGVRGVTNVLRELKMLPPLSKPRDFHPLIAHKTTWVRAGGSGIMLMRPQLGQLVHEGDVLATLADPLGMHVTEVLAPIDGIVIGRTKLPLVHEGDALVHLCSGQRDKQTELTMKRFHSEFNNEINLADETDSEEKGFDG
ncbi:succinylglutamate desuccinylase/aspartoacylase family protein [bacterium]|nr:succinylglutamate desuccinylase/aspartoacylase family protein [bacterium]